MTPSQLLRTLRERGFDVRVDDRQLVVSGPVPRHEARALEQLRASRDDLLVLVETEAHPMVAAAIDLLGAELREVRPAAKRIQDPVAKLDFGAETPLADEARGQVETVPPAPSDHGPPTCGARR